MEIMRAVRHDARAHLWDYALAGAMTLAAVVGLATRLDVDVLDPRPGAPVAIARWFVTIGICVVLVGRRRWPLGCISAIVLLLVVLGVTGNGDTVSHLAMLIALYSAAAALPPRRAAVAVALVLGLAVVSRVGLDNDPTAGLISAAAAFVLGRLIRERRRRQNDELEDAARRARTAIEVAELDAAEDRQRMAQELHDVVAHSLSVIAVRAGIGAHLIEREPDEAIRSLDAIRAAGRTATDELDRLIVMLRDGDTADTEPPPSLAAVAALCAHVGGTHVPVDLVLDGEPRALPAGVSLAAYRIVQEALTNVVRHAGPATATVRIRVTSDHVDITVDDNGHGVTARPDGHQQQAGHGLAGMTERARMYGGTLEAGPSIEGGFRVRASLPVGVGVDVDAVRLDDPAATDVGWTAASNSRLMNVPNAAWDIGLALLLVVLAVRELMSGRSPDEGFAATDGLAWFLEIGCCVAMVARRSFPATSLLVATVLGVALTVGDHSTDIVVAVFVIGLYTVGGHATTARISAALVGIPVAMTVVHWSDPPDLDGAQAVLTGVIAAAAVLTGSLVRLDRDRRDARTAEHHETGIDESRRARLLATTERLRVAEELDRVITRSIATISIAADDASEIIVADPTAAHAMLESISSTSREALAELRRLLRRMHTDGSVAPLAPAGATSRDGTSLNAGS